jgi:cobalt-zinc-cadmium efflux system membrane fusion protein
MADSNSVTFTDAQLRMSEIKWGKLQKKDVSDIVESNGTIELPPQNTSTVTPLLGGNVKEINILPGMFVKKGERLAILEHQDYLMLQEEYIEASSRYNFQKEEYKRQGELSLEQATSLKKMQLTEADFKSLEAKVFSLKKRLDLIGIDVEKLKSEDISSSVEVKSPIDGYITNVYTNRGKYLEAGQSLCEIIDKSHLHLQLNVFEKDLARVKKGQKINFNPAAVPGRTFVATVELIGQSVDNQNHSVPVHAHVTTEENDLKPGMFVNARILANPAYVNVLPLTSLIRKNNGFYVYCRKNGKFERTKIDVGREIDTFVEVLSADSTFLTNDFVTQGAYYLETEWEKSSE